VKKILFVHNHLSTFVRLDLAHLQKHHQVTECYLESRTVNPATIWRQVARHDLVFGWFASWHTFLPTLMARILGKPSVLVIGGYDVANMPDIGYGHHRGGLSRWVSRRAMKWATRLSTFSAFSREEAVHNAGIEPERITTIHLGVPDAFGELPQNSRARMALTVGNVDRSNLKRKGHEAFVRTAALMPDVSFVIAGNWADDAIDYLRSIATPNVTFTGRLSDEELNDYYRKASVYVQASRHEGFGLSVAEAMLAGSVPVVTRAGSLPEVVGDFAVFVDTADPKALASAIENALTRPNEDRAAIRQRILEQFPPARRAELLEQLIEPLISRRTAAFARLQTHVTS